MTTICRRSSAACARSPTSRGSTSGSARRSTRASWRASPPSSTRPRRSPARRARPSYAAGCRRCGTSRTRPTARWPPSTRASSPSSRTTAPSTARGSSGSPRAPSWRSRSTSRARWSRQNASHRAQPARLPSPLPCSRPGPPPCAGGAAARLGSVSWGGGNGARWYGVGAECHVATPYPTPMIAQAG